MLLNCIQSCTPPALFPRLLSHGTLIFSPSHPALSFSISPLSHCCPCSPLIEPFWAVGRPEIPRKVHTPSANNPVTTILSGKHYLGGYPLSPLLLACPAVGWVTEGTKAAPLSWWHPAPSRAASLPPPPPLTSAGSSGQASRSSLRQGTPVTWVNSALLPGGN